MVGGSCQEVSIAEFNAYNLLLLGSWILAALLHLPLEVCMKMLCDRERLLSSPEAYFEGRAWSRRKDNKAEDW